MQNLRRCILGFWALLFFLGLFFKWVLDFNSFLFLWFSELENLCDGSCWEELCLIQSYIHALWDLPSFIARLCARTLDSLRPVLHASHVRTWTFEIRLTSFVVDRNYCMFAIDLRRFRVWAHAIYCLRIFLEKGDGFRFLSYWIVACCLYVECSKKSRKQCWMSL